MSAGVDGAPEDTGDTRHIPVMMAEVLDALSPLDGALICDGTFGAGGYSRAMLEAGAPVIAIDRDPDAKKTALDFTKDYGQRFRFEAGDFSGLDDLAGAPLDGVVLPEVTWTAP